MIITNNTLCSGCRACELACSYHHSKKFGPKLSSIKVVRYVDTGKKKIIIYRDELGSYPSCDECINENFPLCVKYCTSNALVLGED